MHNISDSIICPKCKNQSVTKWGWGGRGVFVSYEIGTQVVTCTQQQEHGKIVLIFFLEKLELNTPTISATGWMLVSPYNVLDYTDQASNFAAAAHTRRWATADLFIVWSLMNHVTIQHVRVFLSSGRVIRWEKLDRKNNKLHQLPILIKINRRFISEITWHPSERYRKPMWSTVLSKWRQHIKSWIIKKKFNVWKPLYECRNEMTSAPPGV